MKHKQKYLILIIIIIGIFICLTIKKEKLVVDINNIGTADLTNDIATVGGDDEELKNNVFLNILNLDPDSNSGSEKPIVSTLTDPPKIIFKSYESCPTLYPIFNGLRAHDNSKQENSIGMEFRNKCESIFYNSDRFVLIEHNIIDLRSEIISQDDSQYKFSNFEFNVDNSGTDIKYIDMEYKKESDMGDFSGSITDAIAADSVQINNSFTQTAKNVNFGVKSNFQLEDVYRFIDYCYTCVCYAMIHIDYLTLTGNHYRVYPCPNPSHGEGSYFILPERIRKQVQEEGKSYTRAKCNMCGLNIIVSFGKFPRKFKHLVNINKTQLDHNTGNSFIRENTDIDLI